MIYTYWLIAYIVTWLLSESPQWAIAGFIVFFAAFAFLLSPAATDRK